MARQGRPTKCYVALLSEGPYLLKEIFTPSTMGPRLWCHLIDPHFQISLALWLAKLLLPTGFMLISPTCMVSHSPTGPAWFHGVAAAGPFKARYMTEVLTHRLQGIHCNSQNISWVNLTVQSRHTLEMK